MSTSLIDFLQWVPHPRLSVLWRDKGGFRGKAYQDTKKKAELALGPDGSETRPHTIWVSYLFSESSLASFILADSSFFCTRARSFWSTSAATVLFHSAIARSQWAAASFSRPVF